MPRGEEILIKIKAEAKQALETLRHVDAQADALKRGFAGAGEVIGKGFKAAAATVAAVGAASVAVGAKMLSGAGNVERYAAVLETVTGSAETAGEKLAWLREFAAKTPFELPGLMEAATKLEAYGFSAERYLGVLGDTSAALGKDVIAAVEALADAATGEFERLKEFGIRASTEGAKVAFEYVDKSGKQQRAVVDKNNREMIASTLTAIWNERYAGAMERMSTTWEGMLSNMKDAFTKALADAGKDLLPAFKPALEEITKFLEGDTFKGILGTIGESFSRLAPVVIRVFEAASPLVDVLGKMVEALTPVFVDLIGRFADVLARAADSLVKSGIVDSVARIVQAVGSEFVDFLDRLLRIAVPLVDIALKVITPLIEIADKLGLIQGFVYALIAAKVASGISSLAQAVMSLASSLMGLGTAASAGTAAAGTAITGGLASLTAPVAATATSIGTAIGGGIVAGVTGYAIGSAIAEGLKSLTGLKRAQEEEVEAEAREAQAGAQLNQVLRERARRIHEIADANRASVMATDAYNERLAMMQKYFQNQETASNMAIASLVDVRAAIEALTAQQVQWLASADDLNEKNPEAAARLREMAKAAGDARLELKAMSGILKEEATAALAQLAPLPGSVADALRSSNPKVAAAGKEAVQTYVRGLAEVAGLPPKEMERISQLVAQATTSSDPQIRQNAFNSVMAIVSTLQANKGLPESSALEIARAVAGALSLSDPTIQVIADTYRRACGAINSALLIGLPQVVANAMPWVEALDEMLRLSHSPGVDVWAPQVYRRALEGIEAEFERARFPVAVESRVTAPLMGGVAAGPGVTLNLHVGTLVSDEKSWEDLARKIQFRYGPRLARAVGVT